MNPPRLNPKTLIEGPSVSAWLWLVLLQEAVFRRAGDGGEVECLWRYWVLLERLFCARPLRWARCAYSVEFCVFHVRSARCLVRALVSTTWWEGVIDGREHMFLRTVSAIWLQFQVIPIVNRRWRHFYPKQLAVRSCEQRSGGRTLQREMGRHGERGNALDETRQQQRGGNPSRTIEGKSRPRTELISGPQSCHSWKKSANIVGFGCVCSSIHYI